MTMHAVIVPRNFTFNSNLTEMASIESYKPVFFSSSEERFLYIKKLTHCITPKFEFLFYTACILASVSGYLPLLGQKTDKCQKTYGFIKYMKEIYLSCTLSQVFALIKFIQVS